MTFRNKPPRSTTKRTAMRVRKGALRRHKPREDLTKFYGVQACLAIFARRKGDIRRMFVLPALEERCKQVLDWCSKRSLPVKVVGEAELATVAGTGHHEGVCIEARPLALMTVKDLLRQLADAREGCIVLLEGVENPHNIGAIIRTASFFGVDGIVLIAKQLGSLSGAACRVAEGGAEFIPLAITNEGESALQAVRAAGFTLVATTPHEARSLYDIRWPRKVALLFGAEGPGLSHDAMTAAEVRVAIPRRGQLESLNVGAAVASVLTEVRRVRLGGATE